MVYPGLLRFFPGFQAVRQQSVCLLVVEQVMVEASPDIGGVWRYDHDKPGGVFEQTRATSSLHFMHAADFPFPEGTPDFPSHTARASRSRR